MIKFITITVFVLFPIYTLAANTQTAPVTSAPIQLNTEMTSQTFEPKPLDGVMIEAIETYPNPQDHELGLGLGIYPFNPYYTGFLINGNYQYNFSRILGWEVIGVHYAYTIQNDLTTELADKYNVNPKKIKRVDMILGSHLQYTILNGKLIYQKKHIRYFKGAVIGGAGYIKTNVDNSLSVDYGLKFEFFASQNFSWRFEAINHMTVSNLTNYISFTLGMGYGL